MVYISSESESRAPIIDPFLMCKEGSAGGKVIMMAIQRIADIVVVALIERGNRGRSSTANAWGVPRILDRWDLDGKQCMMLSTEAGTILGLRWRAPSLLIAVFLETFLDLSS